MMEIKMGENYYRNDIIIKMRQFVVFYKYYFQRRLIRMYLQSLLLLNNFINKNKI